MYSLAVTPLFTGFLFFLSLGVVKVGGSIGGFGCGIQPSFRLRQLRIGGDPLVERRLGMKTCRPLPCWLGCWLDSLTAGSV
jgi:hypothetical protein